MGEADVSKKENNDDHHGLEGNMLCPCCCCRFTIGTDGENECDEGKELKGEIKRE